MRQSDQNPLRPSDIAKLVSILTLDYFAYKFRPVLQEPLDCLIDVVDREHDPEITESIYRGVPVVRDHRRREKAGELDRLTGGRMETRQADWRPKDGQVWVREWLSWGVERVPKLYAALRAGKIEEFGETAKGFDLPEHANEYSNFGLLTRA